MISELHLLCSPIQLIILFHYQFFSDAFNNFYITITFFLINNNDF